MASHCASTLSALARRSGGTGKTSSSPTLEDYVKPRDTLYGSCRSLNDFDFQEIIGEGTYGRVWRAYDRRLEVMVALKQMRLLQHQSSREGFPRTTVREIGLLKQLQHPNIVELLEVVCGPDMSSTLSPKKPKVKDPKEQQPYTGDRSVYLVFEHCEGDLGVLLDARSQPFSASQIKSIMKQLLQGLHHLHANFIMHRDVKLSNILISSSGCVKLADFGLTRMYSEPGRTMSDGVVTLWYRAPELLFGASSYDEKIDMWAVGCIFGELLAHKPFMPGRTEQEQIILMCGLLGTPSEKDWPAPKSPSSFSQLKLPQGKTNTLREVFKNETPNCLDLLNQLLTFNPAKRISARDALLHPYFTEQPPMSCVSLLFASSQLYAKQRNEDKSKRRGAAGGPPLESIFATNRSSPSRAYGIMGLWYVLPITCRFAVTWMVVESRIFVVLMVCRAASPPLKTSYIVDLSINLFMRHSSSATLPIYTSPATTKDAPRRFLLERQ
ncbi:LOW QUALITY PROTEIN: cyclin-dependent kinase 10-like, partial [Ochotona princeps]|uniref:LOW QUALITY PROTEIN: cyclin-dependent kinase 10-like n=1 Tax=Ochotona princeps TaxID=9978 RepID=UPI0027147E87